MHRCENSTYYLLDLETSLDYRVLIHCVTLLIYMLNDTFACSIIFHISKCILDLDLFKGLVQDIQSSVQLYLQKQFLFFILIIFSFYFARVFFFFDIYIFFIITFCTLNHTFHPFITFFYGLYLRVVNLLQLQTWEGPIGDGVGKRPIF